MNRSPIRRRVLACWSVLAVLIAGCGRDDQLHPVRGRLVYLVGEATQSPVMAQLKAKGDHPDSGQSKTPKVAQGIPDAELAFVPRGRSEPLCRARTDADGKFAVETPARGAGMPVGSYRVVVTVPENFKKPVHQRYESIEDTPLVLEVSAQGVEHAMLQIGKD